MARPMFPVIFSLPWKKACEKKNKHKVIQTVLNLKYGSLCIGGGEENYMLLVLRVTVRD